MAGRSRRNSRRWDNPLSELQAARYERRLYGREVVQLVRQLCPGRKGQPCSLNESKLSDYERGLRRPGVDHMEALCRIYGKSPEELGLIRWQQEPPPPPRSWRERRDDDGAMALRLAGDTEADADSTEAILLDWVQACGTQMLTEIVLMLHRRLVRDRDRIV